MLLNARSDEMALENGFIASDLSLAETRARHHANVYAAELDDPALYSLAIRPHLREASSLKQGEGGAVPSGGQ